MGIALLTKLCRDYMHSFFESGNHVKKCIQATTKNNVRFGLNIIYCLVGVFLNFRPLSKGITKKNKARFPPRKGVTNFFVKLLLMAYQKFKKKRLKIFKRTLRKNITRSFFVPEFPSNAKFGV